MRPSDNPPRGTPESCFYGRKGHLFWAFLEAYTVRGVLKRDFSTYRTSEPHCTHPVISIDRSNRKTHEKLPFPLPPSGLYRRREQALTVALVRGREHAPLLALLIRSTPAKNLVVDLMVGEERAISRGFFG